MKNATPARVAGMSMMVFTLALPANGADWSQYRENEARVKAIAANPEAIGDKELQFLMSHLYYPDSITAITKVQTPAAHAALWQMALGGGNGSQAAAYTLIKRMTNKTEAVKLLASKSQEVQAIALRSMVGSPLDRTSWALVKEVLVSDSLEVRRDAACVAGNDSGKQVSALEKAQVLIQAMTGLESLPGAKEQVGYEDLICTQSEITHFEFAQALLSRRLDLNPEMLRLSTPREPGTMRDFLLIARARRGEDAVKEELRRIVRQAVSPLLRLQVILALTLAGTAEDVPVLEEVAQDDPAVVRNWLPHTYVSPADGIPKDYYPLRERAKQAIKAIQTHTGEPPGTNSPSGKPSQK